MARDRTARTRIRNYLVANGPVDDPSGHATNVLKDLISYEGSAVAFIQLIAAMDRDGEISRDIRGKRTYRICATPAAERAVAPRPAPAGPEVLRVPLSEATAGTGGEVRIDYDKLARALVRQLWDFAATAAPGESSESITADIEALREERDRMIQERNEYAQRLQMARVKLDELLGVSEQQGAEVKA